MDQKVWETSRCAISSIAQSDIEEDFCILRFDGRTKSKKIPHHPTQEVLVVQANSWIQKSSQHHSAFSSLSHAEEGVLNVIEDCVDESQNLLASSSFQSDSESKLLRSAVDWTFKNRFKRHQPKNWLIVRHVTNPQLSQNLKGNYWILTSDLITKHQWKICKY